MPNDKQGPRVGPLTALVVLGVAGGVLGTLWSDSTSTDTPVSLKNVVQGSCSKGQVSTDRGCVTPPQITKKIRPRTPREALRDRVEGKVVLNVTVEVDGTVDPIELVDSTNPGHGFEDAVVSAVKQWRYKPANIAGTPVRAVFTLNVDFTPG